MKKFVIYGLSILLGILFYWVLGFMLDDMTQWPGLKAETYLAPIKHSQLQLSQNKLGKQIEQLQKQVSDTKSQQDILKENMKNTQSILNQIMDMQKLQAGKKQANAATLVDTFKKNTDVFLSQQNQLQQYNQSLAQLNSQLLPLQNARENNSKKLYKIYDKAQEKYAFKIGLIQIGILLVLLLITSFIVRKRAGSPYRLIWWAINISVVVKIFFVIHDYFPSRYFKYILIAALIVAVWFALVKLIKHQLSPGKKQFRAGYAKFLCGVCQFPIRRKDNETYRCPDCGTQLFEKCQNCQGIKHSLLPYCEHCGVSSNI